MKWTSIFATATFLSRSNALIRFGCSQLVVQRLDPLVNPGLVPSPHLHQIVGGVCTFPFINLETHSYRTHSKHTWIRKMTSQPSQIVQRANLVKTSQTTGLQLCILKHVMAHTNGSLRWEMLDLKALEMEE
jgi:hypothetical protein